ncbi:hypothetical protein SAMN02800692_3595 [Luteibacter sp. UNC138MFCol5.1]|uniref:hypothetical protein n=1 Tax=Luteibacter sp. UNC138MFCol5.1 TaxID=1502774 RepID=UPI0008CB1602|nr:hypothetical protein [Luteibacter sp. UNC138MFCol5.1]SEP09125.1 hypothetical protein SAMN02800692_3595 [Luteibacter sp. UNC138MFCol5.1]
MNLIRAAAAAMIASSVGVTARLSAAPSDTFVENTVEANDGHQPDVVRPAIDHFRRYDSAGFGDRRCTVGASTDEDGLNQRPYVFVSDVASRKIVWGRYIPFAREFYEGRATHCLAHDGHLYVLLQVDTDSHQATNQTIVSVVKMRESDGEVIRIVENRLHGVTGAVTEWVSHREGTFRVENDHILVAGSYRKLDSEDIKTFSTVVGF